MCSACCPLERPHQSDWKQHEHILLFLNSWHSKARTPTDAERKHTLTAQEVLGSKRPPNAKRSIYEWGENIPQFSPSILVVLMLLQASLSGDFSHQLRPQQSGYLPSFPFRSLLSFAFAHRPGFNLMAGSLYNASSLLKWYFSARCRLKGVRVLMLGRCKYASGDAGARAGPSHPVCDVTL